MNAKETGRVLAKCASYDRRKIGDADVIAWFQVLGDLAYDDCITAVIGHYTDTTDWIMPAHVRRRVRDIRDKRIDATEIPEPPRELAGNPPAWREAIRVARVAIADGRDPEAAMLAVAHQARRELEA